MAHALPTLFADAILFLVMGGGSNQPDVVLMEEGEKLDGQKLAARIDVRLGKVLSKVVINRWAVIDFVNLELIDDITRAQTSETEKDTITGEGINDDQAMGVVDVAGDTTRSRIGDNIAEKDFTGFSGRGDSDRASICSTDSVNFTANAEGSGSGEMEV
jgi:hypothetical protein